MFRRLGLILTTTLAALALVTPPASAAPGMSPAHSSPLPALLSTSSPAVPPLLTARRRTIVDVAHRGASAYAPENTLAAFRRAMAQHAQMVELDVQQTKDHKLVLMHDTTLNRTTNIRGVYPRRAYDQVRSFTLAEIKELDAGSWFGKKYKGERVPTLAEALHALNGSGIGLLLEIKSPGLYPGIEARVAAELRRNSSWLRPGRLIVQSFDWNSVRTFHRLLPSVRIGLLGTPSAAQLPKLAAFATQINSPYGHLTAAYVRLVHSHHMEVFAWTVNDPSMVRRLISYRVDGIITNKPDMLRRL